MDDLEVTTVDSMKAQWWVLFFRPLLSWAPLIKSEKWSCVVSLLKGSHHLSTINLWEEFGLATDIPFPLPHD